MKLIYLHLIQAFRSMQRNYLQTLLSSIGLIVGFSSFVFAFNWLRYELTYDSFRPDSENIRAVCNHNQNQEWYNYSQPYPMYTLLRDSIPGVTDVAIMGSAQMRYLAGKDDRNLSDTFSNSCFVNPGFLKMMGVKLLYGDPETALNRIDGVVITQKMAQAIFQREDVLGETLKAEKYVNGPSVQQILTITGVAEDGYVHTSIAFDMLIAMGNFSEDWWNNWSNYNPNIFFKAVNPDDVDQRLRNRLVEGRSIFFTTPLSQMRHTYGLWNGLKYPTIAVVVSVLLLLSALFNYIAILTAQFVGRFREYKLRISLGGSFASNTLWLYSEVLIMFVLLFLGTGMMLELISAWSDMTDINSTLFQTFAILIPICFLLLFLAALYPVIYLRYIYYRSFSGKTRIKGGNASMVFVQVLVCALFLFVFINAYRQFYFITHANLGFNYERVIRLYTSNSPFDTKLVESILQELRTHQGGSIENVVASPSSIFHSTSYGARDFSWGEGGEPMECASIFVPANVFQFFDIRPVSGKIYDGKQENGIPQVLLNKDAADMLHYTEKSPSRLLEKNNPMEVVGVVDFYARNFRDEAFPVVYHYTEKEVDNRHEVLFVRYKEGQYTQAMQIINEMLTKRGISPESVMIAEMDHYISQFYEKEAHFLRLISIMFMASILITLLGVLSQISYTLRMHRKFIAVRCVFGASYLDLCRRYLREYVLLTVVACAVSLPVGYYFTTQWLQEYRASVSVGLFECLWMGGLLLLLVSIVIIIRLTQALNENPAEVIKSE